MRTLVCLSLLCLAPALAARAAEGEFEFNVELGPKALGKDLSQIALWLSDTDGKHLATGFVTKAVGKEGLGNAYMTLFGIVLREAPESLPVWAYSRGVRYGKKVYPPKSQPLPDAITGATPKTAQFSRTFRTPVDAQVGTLRPCLEINVSRDKTASMVFTGDLAVGGGEAQCALHFVGCGDPKGAGGAITPADGASVGEYVKQVVVKYRPVTQ